MRLYGKKGYGFAVAIPAINTMVMPDHRRGHAGAIMLYQQNALGFSTPPVETSSTHDGDAAVLQRSFRHAMSQKELNAHAWGLPPATSHIYVERESRSWV